MLLTIFRAELWWKYLDSENVWAPPPFTFIDLLERAISRLRLEIKHKAYLGRQETENPSALSTQLSVHINHQKDIRNEFLSKYLKLLTFTTLFIEVSIKIVFLSLEVSRWDVLHSWCVQLHYCNGLCLHS